MVFRVALAQLRNRVGDISGNATQMKHLWEQADSAGADLVVFPELALTGYPPEDLLLKREVVNANLDAMTQLSQIATLHSAAVIGHVGRSENNEPNPGEQWDAPQHTRSLTNALSVLHRGNVRATYRKQRLPNYGVFDERRYFMAGNDTCVVTLNDTRVGFLICEDLWSDTGPGQRLVNAGIDVLVVINASPYHQGKRDDRELWCRTYATRGQMHVVYLNTVGGQDDVVFDGDSFVLDPTGAVVCRLAQFRDDFVICDLAIGSDNPTNPRPRLPPVVSMPRLEPNAEVWEALVCATHDYCANNGFQQVVLGLSGGIDSAVTAAIAADALGAEHVTGIALPSPYSSEHSRTDAAEAAKLLGITFHELPIGAPLAALSDVLDGLVVTGFNRPDGRKAGVAYENMQSRLRGLTVMALANEMNAIALTTGNKSEYAVGYATLYGDMAGGYGPLKDVEKTLVFELARWRNTQSLVIPLNTIEKPPSAELRPGQFDSDSLPDYPILDAIIRMYVEQAASLADIVAAGIDRQTAARVIRMIDRAEFKRRQAAPGPKITIRAFGRDRRMPITQLWRD
ncbi:MAG: NAD+ synthase [Nitriliruptoraceae bacterium]